MPEEDRPEWRAVRGHNHRYDGRALPRELDHIPTRPQAASFPGEAMGYANIAYRVMDELDRAHKKFPDQHLPWGGGPNRSVLAFGQGNMATTRDVHREMVDAQLAHGTCTWFDVVAEEFLEAGAEDNMRKACAELVQTAAMCFRAIADMEQEMRRRENAHQHGSITDGMEFRMCSDPTCKEPFPHGHNVLPPG